MPFARRDNARQVSAPCLSHKPGEVHRRPYNAVKLAFPSELALTIVAVRDAVAVAGKSSFSAFSACTVKL